MGAVTLDRAGSEQLLYGGAGPQEKPRYTLAQAAHYLHLSPTTLRSWVRGRYYPTTGGPGHFSPLIRAGERLSFSNLVEAHVLRALRVDHKVRMSAVREALDYAETEFRMERLLLSRELLAAPGSVFLERYGQLINLSRSGQLAARQLLEAQLRRIEWDLSGMPIRLFPTGATGEEARKVVVIDPRISFGEPVVASRAIRTSAIVGRIDAGEAPDLVARDYGLEPYEIDAAILYEKAAA